MRLLLRTLLIAVALIGTQSATSQPRSLYSEVSPGRVVLGNTESGAKLKEGTAIFVEIEDVTLKLKIERLGISGLGRQTIVAGDAAARLHLVRGEKDQWDGRLRWSGERYLIAGSLDALAVQKLPEPMRPDVSARPPIEGERMQMLELQPQSPSTAAPTILDLLVILEADVDPSFVDLSVLVANDSLFLSDLPVQLRIVAVEFLDDPVDGEMSDILDRAYQRQGEFSDVPRPWTVGADIAAVFANPDPGGDTCGISFLGVYQVDGDLFYDPRLYSVIDPDELRCGEYVFAHEFGHNMGGAHDRENVSEELSEFVAFPFAYGYVDGIFGTIMSYATFLDPYYSNPDINECGPAAENPCGVSEDMEEPADVSQMVEIFAPFLTQIADPLAGGARIRVNAGAECRPVTPQGNDGLEWRDRGLVNNGGNTIDVVCPLQRHVIEGEDGIEPAPPSGYFFSITLGNESAEDEFLTCVLVETVSGTEVYSYLAVQRVPRDAELGHTIVFPRVTAQDSALSAYSVNCRLPAGGVIQQLSSIAVN